jgi:hypothetical protein
MRGDLMAGLLKIRGGEVESARIGAMQYRFSVDRATSLYGDTFRAFQILNACKMLNGHERPKRGSYIGSS